MSETELSRRERQIMDVLFAAEEADVQEIQAALPNPPGDMAVRKMLSILESKEIVTRRKEGRRFLYRPREGRKRAGSSALNHLLSTFFGGSVEEALATHLGDPKTSLSDEELSRMIHMIEQARQKKGADQS